MIILIETEKNVQMKVRTITEAKVALKIFIAAEADPVRQLLQRGVGEGHRMTVSTSG